MSNDSAELTAEEIGPEVAAMLEAMARPMPPADEVVTLARIDVEAILRELEDTQAGIGAVSPSQSIRLLREALALPKVELWAIHIVGPGEIHPCMSKDDAEQQAQAVRDSCMHAKEVLIAKGESVEYWPDPIINVIPSPWEPTEHFEIAAAEWQEEAERLRGFLVKEEPAGAEQGGSAAPAQKNRAPACGSGGIEE